MAYSQLTIHQKINAKASALNYGRYYGTLVNNWQAMKVFSMDLVAYRFDKIYTFSK